MRNSLKALWFVGIGLVIGVSLGLYVGWIAWPTEFTNANPAVLQVGYQRDYVQMVADAYAVDNDLAAARRRLANVADDGPALLTRFTLDKILAGEDEEEIRRLARLANALGLSSPAWQPYLTEEAVP